MCIICTKEYDNNTTTINSCENVTEIPLLPNLIHLDCSNTRVTKIPVLQKLKFLSCDNTKISKLPNLPNLKKLNCENSTITEIPPNLEWVWCRKTCIIKEPVNCEGIWNTCFWINPSNFRLKKLKTLQRFFRKEIKKRKNEIKQLPILKDLINIIINY